MNEDKLSMGDGNQGLVWLISVYLPAARDLLLLINEIKDGTSYLQGWSLLV